MKTGWIGRRLPRIAWTSGLEDVEVTPRSIFVDFDFFGLLLGGHLARMRANGALPAEQLASWWNDLADQHAAGQFFAGFTAFIVSGTKRLA
jgi:hypothetical protein